MGDGLACDPRGALVPSTGLKGRLGVQALITAATLPGSRVSALLSLLPSFLNWGRGEGRAVFDLGGGKKSVLFRLLANTTNSV